jgi:hypothetical protein
MVIKAFRKLSDCRWMQFFCDFTNAHRVLLVKQATKFREEDRVRGNHDGSLTGLQVVGQCGWSGYNFAYGVIKLEHID